MGIKSNARRTVRVSLSAPAEAEGPRGPVRGTCRSLSRAGMFFAGPVSPVGRSISLAVELPAFGRFRAVGEVRYHHGAAGGKGMGIRFTRLAQEDLALIARFIDQAQ